MNKINVGLAAVMAALALFSVFIGSAQASTVLTFSDLDGLQDNQLFQIYGAGNNSTLTLIQEINSSETLNHTVVLEDGSYIIVSYPNKENVFAKNPIRGLDYVAGLVPILGTYLIYVVIAAACLALIVYAIYRRWI